MEQAGQTEAASPWIAQVQSVGEGRISRPGGDRPSAVQLRGRFILLFHR